MGKCRSRIIRTIPILTIGIIMFNWYWIFNEVEYNIPFNYIQWSFLLISFSMILLNLWIYKKEKLASEIVDIKGKLFYVYIIVVLGVLAPIMEFILASCIDFDGNKTMLLLSHTLGMVLVVILYLYFGVVKRIYIWNPVSLYSAIYLLAIGDVEEGFWYTSILLIGRYPSWIFVILECVVMIMLNKRFWYGMTLDIKHGEEKNIVDIDVQKSKKNAVRYMGIGIGYLLACLLITYLMRYTCYFNTTILAIVSVGGLLFMIFGFREYYNLWRASSNTIEISNDNRTLLLPMIVFGICYLIRDISLYGLRDSNVELWSFFGVLSVILVMIIWFVWMYKRQIFVWCPISLYGSLIAGIICQEGTIAFIDVLCLVASVECVLTILLNGGCDILGLLTVLIRNRHQ